MADQGCRDDDRSHDPQGTVRDTFTLVEFGGQMDIEAPSGFSHYRFAKVAGGTHDSRPEAGREA